MRPNPLMAIRVDITGSLPALYIIIAAGSRPTVHGCAASAQHPMEMALRHDEQRPGPFVIVACLQCNGATGGRWCSVLAQLGHCGRRYRLRGNAEMLIKVLVGCAGAE